MRWKFGVFKFPVRTDRGTEFLNKTLNAFFKEEGIEHQTSTPRTPKQNGVVKRRNRTLVEAARTMLLASKLPLFFWAEAITTACYTQNRSIIIPTYEKMAYHIINDRKPLIKHLHIFGCTLVDRSMTVDDLLQLVPKLITKIDSLETELKQTKLTMGKALVKLVKKVKKMEDVLKRRHVVLPNSEDEDAEISSKQGRNLQEEGEVDYQPYNLRAAKLCQRLPSRREEEELTEQQKQRKAQVQFEAQHYTEEDWDAIRAKLEANAELTKNVLGKELPEEDFAKKMVDGTWKLTQLKKLSFEEVKEEFDKLVKQVESFVPINIEATKAQLKRYGEELQTEISKKQRIDVSDTEEKVGKVKEEEPVKRVGKRKKQKARKGISIDKSPQGDSETDKEESVEAMNSTSYADTVYMSFGAMLKDFTREDLIELYRLVMQKYGTNRPEDAYDRVLWSDLRTMFDPPLNEDAIWSLPLQQKMISWRYYDKCAVHCLTLEACNIYMLADRKYPLSKDACQVMLKMKLLDGKMNEVCYKLLKMIEKQAGVKK
ncbi:retrovirus-related pol polyprotein from transposon TNT 1-94 [Tanacetum coccineum]